MNQELAKLEGLILGLEQQGELSAAHQVRWAAKRITFLEEALLDTIVMFENFERNRTSTGTAARGQYEAMARHLRKLLRSE